ISNQKIFLGILLFISSGFILAIEDALIKLLPDSISVLQIVFFNNIFAIIPVVLIAFLKKAKIKIHKENLLLHFLRSIFSLLTILFFIAALRLISLSQTLTLS